MAQVGIVRRGGAWFREYAIEPGDVLVHICLRFGQRNWRQIYNHSENAAFRERFPDPNKIDYVNPVNLFIPLAGGAKGGQSKRGTPIGDFMIARIKNETGEPLAGITLRSIGPEMPHEGEDIKANADGEIIIPNPSPGEWFLVSKEHELIRRGESKAYPVEEVTATSSHTTTDFSLMRNGVDEIVARKVYYLICPMCGITFKTVKPETGGPNLCPNDGFNLTTIEVDIEADAASFKAAPNPPQNPKATPKSLKCRGSRSLDTAHGQVTVFWDESRFVLPDQDDYVLSKTTDSGQPIKINIIGRKTWGAAEPIFTPNANGKPRSYEFHLTARGATTKYPYKLMGILSNETNPLSSGSVLRWMTIHHSVRHKTPSDIQNEHQNVGIGKDHNNKAADVGYHFIITSDGTIFEGRPLGIKGAHAESFNGGNIGIVLCGDFQTLPLPLIGGDTPTTEVLQSLDNLVDVLAARFGVKSVWSHKERKKQAELPETECPGRRLIPHVEDLRQKYPGPPE